MKFILSVVVVLAVTLTHAKPTPEQMEKIQKAMEVCKPKAGATEEDMGLLMKHEVPETKTGQCFIACMNKEFGVMSADNKIDVARIKEMAAPLKEKDADKYEKGMKVIETCAAEANSETDECEMAAKMMKCCKKEGAAHVGAVISRQLTTIKDITSEGVIRVGLQLSDFMED